MVFKNYVSRTEARIERAKVESRVSGTTKVHSSLLVDDESSEFDSLSSELSFEEES